MRRARFGNARPRRRDIVVGAAIALSAAAILMVAAAFARHTISELRSIESAQSDNMQWNLPQVEVEYLMFLYALRTAEPDGLPDLADIRLRFDIFFSRIDTLTLSSVYKTLSDAPNFMTSLTRIMAFLDPSVLVIDGPDAELAASLPALRAEARALRDTVRTLSVSGLSHFARRADARRAEVAETLTQLSIVTGILFLALTALSVFLFLVFRRTEAKSLDLEQANQRMDTILSTSLDGVIVTDDMGRIQEFNGAAEAIFGRRQDWALNRNIGELFSPGQLSGERSSGPEETWAGRNMAGQGRVQLEGHHADGTVFPVEFALQTAFDGRREIRVGFVRDISERVQAKLDLVEARDHALAGEQAKADFLTMMSHEIRTPLNGLLGNLSLLEETDLNARQREFVRNMGISGRILIDHVDAVLDISRLESARLDVAREPTNLNDMLQDLVDGQKGLAQALGSDISWRWVGPGLDWVATDSARLQQVLLNLVGNAVKFTRNGHILIEAELGKTDAAQSGKRHQVEFRVCDTGPGIAECDLDRVFEDFQTSDVSFGRVTGGTGLGLGIARRLVAAMGGEIGVESILGEGSTFWIQLPLDCADAPTVFSPRADARDSQSHLKVLVIEDNPINRQVAESMLEREGHAVTSAEDGRTGVAAAARDRYDLILMDIAMPVMDGLDATRRIRTGNGPSAHSTIVALSANVLPRDRDRYFESGMDAFLGKPMTIADLRRTLATLQRGPVRPTVPDLTDPIDSIDPMDPELDAGQWTQMRDHLDAEGFSGLRDRFITAGETLVAQLAADRTAGTDMKTLADTCHKTAGSAAVFGAVHFRRALLDLELAANRGDLEEFNDLASRISAVWARTRSAVARLDPERAPSRA